MTPLKLAMMIMRGLTTHSIDLKACMTWLYLLCFFNGGGRASITSIRRFYDLYDIGWVWNDRDGFHYGHLLYIGCHVLDGPCMYKRWCCMCSLGKKKMDNIWALRKKNGV